MITKEDLAEIALKILAIVLFLQNITEIYASAILSETLAHNPHLPLRSLAMMIMPYLAPIFIIILCFILWFHARKISLFITKSNKSIDEESKNYDLQAILFTCVGLGSLIYYLPWLLRDITLFISLKETYNIFHNAGIALFCHLIQVILSLWLIFGSQKLSTIINKIRGY